MQINSINDFVTFGRAAIASFKKDAVQKIATEAQKQIKETSRGGHSANIKYKQDGFIVGELKNVNDPLGKEAAEVERATQAYARTYKNLSGKSYISNIVDRG